jgi:hypothetical protein
MFLPLIQRQTPPKQWNCASPAPFACRTFPPYSPLSRPPVFGWLLRLQSSTGGHLRPWCILCFFLFCYSIQHPKRWDGVPSRAPRPAHLRSNTPPTASALLFEIPKRQPPKARARRISLFFVRPILMLQLTEPATARAH